MSGFPSSEDWARAQPRRCCAAFGLAGGGVRRGPDNARQSCAVLAAAACRAAVRQGSTDEAAQVITQCAREDIQHPARCGQPPTRTACGRSRTRRSCCMCAAGGRISTPCRASRSSARGRRRAYGVQVAGTIGAELAQAGFVTVSGMALGNDAAAHRGALRAGGLTVAVLAGGPDVCYPPQNRALMGDILLSGAVISEYPPGTEPDGRNYKSRNRIISGLSRRDGHRGGRKRALGRAHHRASRARPGPRRLRGPRCDGRAAVQSVQRADRAGARPPC